MDTSEISRAEVSRAGAILRRLSPGPRFRRLAARGGIFPLLGGLVVRWPLIVIGFWIALAAFLSLTFPPLPVVAAKNQENPLPDDAPVLVTAKRMAEAFHDSATGSILMIILTDEHGLGPADEQTYRQLVDKLYQDKQDNMSIQEFISTPQLREVLASKDNKAWNLPITFPGDLGAPATQAGFHHVAEIVKKTTAGTSLTAHLTGPVATIADVTAIGQEDVHLIEIGTGLMVLIILLLVYRNVITMSVPLITIGISLATAQGVLSGLSGIGLKVNTETLVLMSGVMIGAGTDYAVFLISRYHDYVRHGTDSDDAVKKALTSIGKVIAASAATVAITFLAMIFCQLKVFAEVGPAISIAILVAFLAAVTVLPAILVLCGRRGWIKPRRELTTRFWRLSGIRTVRRPRIHLVGSLIVLVTLASCATLAHFNYDDLKTLPESVDSAAGYAAIDRHFPQNAMSPEVLFIQSSRDLRKPAALADLEQMANRVSQLPNIIMVRGLTRPTGEPLEQTKLSFQAGEVGGKLDDGAHQIKDHGGDLDKLANGANQLAGALADVKSQVNQAVASLSPLLGALSYMEGVMGSDKTLNDLDKMGKLAGNMRSLGDALSANLAGIEDIIGWASPLLAALNASPICSADPACVSSRADLQQLVTARNNGTLNSIAGLATSLQSTQDFQTLGTTVRNLRNALNKAQSALQSVNGLQAKITALQQGANLLADGSRQLADGVQELVDQTKNIGAGLNEASEFLLAMKHDAGKSSMSGFNIPAQFLAADDFKKGAQIFISPDGHAARYFIQSGLNPFTTAAMDQVDTIIRAAESARPNTELSDAKILLAGVPTGLRDTRDYYNGDIRFIVMATVFIVFLILVVLLRALVAPLYLIGSVLISYLSALGIGVIVFQLILGKDLHWSLPGLTFILLVAVGADYNMLLISRIRDESPHGVRVGVIRTVGSTGGVITSAGLIFAASMFGLLFATISTMAQAGFIIGIGIMLDTFLVRTVTVPALAAMIGQANWWPSRLGPGANKRPSWGQRMQSQLTRLLYVRILRRQASAGHATQAPNPRRKAEQNAIALDDEPARQFASAHSPVTPAAAANGGNDKSFINRFATHPLPLFDPFGPLYQPSADLPEKTSSYSTNTDGHALPLFGPHAQPCQPSNDTEETPSNYSSSIIGNGINPSHALPLFGNN
ncbi:MAG: RND family transporter [Mycobacteriaceae bacterium]|nr:RND family transporter [Mycobacteriaceae bacterium]